MKERRHDIDWLRVIAVLAVFLYHCARFFDTEGWLLKNPEQSATVDGIRGVMAWPWLMELFFLLSGVGSWYALKSRSGGAYLWNRVKRLLIPLYGVGLLLLNPIQFYFGITTNHGFTGGFWQSLPLYLRSWQVHLNSAEGVVPVPPAMHLWFLQYLFLMSLLALPLFIFLKGETGRKIIDVLARWAGRPGGIFLLFPPVALILTLFPHVGEGAHTWADFLWYAAFFVTGYVFAADRRFSEGLAKYQMTTGWVCLGLWSAFLVLGALLPEVLVNDAERWTSWFAVFFMVSLGARYMTSGTKLLSRANEAVLPFYLLHHTVIVCVGWFVIRWDMAILAKFLIIAAISFPLIALLYELGVRRIGLLRVLFGMGRAAKAGTRAPSGETPSS
ncbi:MAG: acyltransferase family protein [Planctomycetota bacterium]|jgi:peptidoglycan/LPS O-acetylase OafA/YrhL